MGYTGPEPIIDSILTELAANLPAKLAALQALLVPVLQLDPPAAGEYTFGERQIHTTYPAIEVFPVTSPVLKDNVATMTLQHNIGLAIFVRDPLPGNLSRLRLRYARAVLEVLADRRAAGALTLEWNEEELDWSPTRVADRNLFEQDVMFAVRATRGESRT